jgi:hypothetical protein
MIRVKRPHAVEELPDAPSPDGGDRRAPPSSAVGHTCVAIRCSQVRTADRW